MDISTKIKNLGLAKVAIDNGGSIHTLLISSELTNGTGLMNPSVYIDNGRPVVIIRHVNYTLYHSENKKFQHRYGPLQYLHPENDLTLRTWNFYGELDNNLVLTRAASIDTSKFDVEPKWEFVGLEDARLFRWDKKLYLSGVRRDTTTNGEGRMELSEISVHQNGVTEISRIRIPAPGANDSYCEKNWMPILDQPYHYVKWSNPTEIVKFDPTSKTTQTVHLDTTKHIAGVPDFRGSSQVLPYGNYYLAITHELNFIKPVVGNKDAVYSHRFIVWDRNWNIVKYTDAFNFMQADIEFCCGAAFYNNKLLLSFGFQDNCAFILQMTKKTLFDILGL